MKNQEIKEYRLLYTENGEIKDNGTRWDTLSQLQADFSDSTTVTARQWAIIPADELPENWPEMTIANGVLAPAPAAILEARQAARRAAETERTRAARESRYRAETDPMMLDALEAFAIAHPDDPAFAAWIAAKAQIRTDLPKPETANQKR